MAHDDDLSKLAQPTLGAEVQFRLTLIARAVGGGKVSITARQNRRISERHPWWTLSIETSVAGAAVALEFVGAELDVLLTDAEATLKGLGILTLPELEIAVKAAIERYDEPAAADAPAPGLPADE